MLTDYTPGFADTWQVGQAIQGVASMLVIACTTDGHIVYLGLCLHARAHTHTHTHTHTRKLHTRKS